MEPLSEARKRTIAGRARTLQERLDSDVAAGSGEDGVEEYIEEWRENVADGDSEAFRRRLRREGLGPEECRRRLAADGWPDGEPLPGWVDRLSDLVGFVRDHGSVEVDLGTDEELPFVDVAAPFLAYARERADDPPSDRVAPSAARGLDAWLARRLDRLWSHTLFVEFKTHVATDDPDLVFDDDATPDADSTAYYDAFTDDLVDERLASFFEEYAFLGRLVVGLVDQWVARVGEFYARLTDDWAALRETFGDGELGTVTDVRALGDAHRDGRTVLGVVFESGTRVAYKPRNPGIAVGYYDLLAWLDEAGDLPDLRTLSFVPRDDYAWMEWVRPEECANEAEAAAYYRRAGMHMCLFYALAATDMHLENIVAEGPQPVPVDLETLAEPVVRPRMRSINETVKVVADTVVRTGVVPRHVPVDEVSDVGGFSVQRGEVDIEVQQFRDVNTDAMELEERPLPDLEGRNLPEVDGRVVGPRENADAIARGFGEMYRLLVDERPAVLADDGPIEGLADRGATVRVLYRPTAVYSHVRDAMRSPSCLRTGVQFGVEVESLAKVVATGEVDPAVWSVYEAERAVLRQFNTPRLEVRMDGTDAYDREEVVVSDLFETTPVEQVRQRIRDLDEADLREQLDYVRWGYGGYESAHTPASTEAVPEGAPGGGDLEVVSAAAALDVYERTVAGSRDEDGTLTWILREVGPDGGVHVHPIEDRLYDGRVGVAVFAAALGRVLGERRFEDLAREAVAPVLAALEAGEFRNDPESRRSPPRPVGGAVGLGSVVYGLTRVGTLLDDGRYVRAARRVAALLSPERIEADDRYDVLGGSAGAVLGLLALHDATGAGDPLERARTAGDHLVGSAGEHDGALAWPRPDGGPPLCGFSHGVAGIAYALARLGEATGESRFRSAAGESLAYERRRYDATADNWPDLRAATDGDWMDAWCHGRTGVGLARLGMLEVDPTPEVRRDVDRAVGGVDPSALSDVDHVCCGNFGRVALLLRAARTLGAPEHRDAAERLVAASVRRAETAGRFSTQWQTDRWHNPAFFTGEAGVGYTLLRFLDPSLPCVLLWE